MRWHEILDRLPDGPCVGAEVGVHNGQNAKMLIKRRDLAMYLIDRWRPAPCYDDVQLTEQEWEASYRRVCCEMDGFAARVAVWRSSSEESAPLIADDVLDFVFLDAEHAFKAVFGDIERWWPKVKFGGFIGGHDFGDDRDGWDVQGAVEAWLSGKSHLLRLELGDDATWFVRKP